MLVSLNWIKQFVDMSETDTQKISDILTEKSAEVEDIHDQRSAFENIVVGKIESVEAHPDADSLRVCMMNVGKEENVQIVCGGSNLEVGQDCVVALLGASVVFHGEGEKVVMKKTKIRGVESLGMICSADEVGLGEMFPREGEKEIIDISHLSIAAGTNVATALGMDDTVYEIENTSITNRPDLFSHIGFAREFVACDLGTMKSLQKEHTTYEKGNDLPVEIIFPKNAEEIVPAYSAISISGVDGTVESPSHMKKLLKSVDIEPKNALVDVTNFVMFEMGMPLHAFDMDRVGKQWTISLAKGGETMTNLDGVEKTLPENAIIMTDENGVIFDMCGIQGGQNSGIVDETKNIVLHAPVYDAVKIRRASIAVDQRTDASVIYEKSIPTRLATQGLVRAVEILKEIFPQANVTSTLFEQFFVPGEDRVISLSLDSVHKKLGIDISKERVVSILESLGFGVRSTTDDMLEITVPYFREGDISIPEDFTEEIARIYGLNEIEGVAPEVTIEEKPKLPQRQVEQRVADSLVSNGAFEVLTLAFYGNKLLSRMEMPTENEAHILVKNPLSEDVAVMRTSLSPRLFEVAERNIRHLDAFRIFESGKVFSMNNGEKIEETRITALLVGDDFFSAKAIAEDIFSSFAVPSRIASKEFPLSFAHPGRGAVMTAGKDAHIKVFEIHPKTAKEFGLPKNTSIVCATLSPFESLLGKKKQMTALPKFPGIDFDMAIICDDVLPVEKLTKNLNRVDSLITKCEVDSVWRGEGVEEGKKSVTLSFTFQSDEGTLTDKQAKAIEKKLLAEIEKRGGVARF